jgi:nucleotide-binding universal stress UspA family protein
MVVKVLIAVDDSPWSQAAIDFVEGMAWPARTEMIVVSAAAPMQSAYAFQDYPGAAPVLTPEMLEQQRQHHEDIAKRYAQQLRESSHTIRADVVTADPREAIVEVATREGVDLIVVGSHGRSGLKKLLLGSVSSHVVSHAPCSVLVVKLPRRK